MPRITRKQFLQSRQALRSWWFESHGAVFADLSPREQWDLHDYFRLTDDLTEAELLAHRKQISKDRPSLPQCAGRALHLLVGMLQEPVEPLPVVRRQPGVRQPTVRARSISVRSVVKPHPDVHKLARAILHEALEQYRKDHPEERERP